MAWGSTFLDIIEERGPFKPIVKIVKHQFSQWGNSPTFTACTHPNLITSDRGIIEGSISMNGYKLSTQNWVVSGGGFSFATDRNPCAYLTRGHVLRLYLGFDGLEESAWGILDWGVVDNIVAQGAVEIVNNPTSRGPWTVTCSGFFSGFQNRPSNQLDRITLFGSSTVGPAATTSGASTTIAGDYTAADAVLDVASVAGFETGDGDYGAVIVTGNNGGTFYGLFDGTSGSNFDAFAGGVFGTLDQDADTGNAVFEVPFLYNHPSILFRRILASTGVGTNGAFDVYPLTWGQGIDNDYIDHDDADLWYDASNIDGLKIAAIPPVSENDAALANALQWIIGVLAPGGWFPVITQGQFSLRCAVDPEDEGDTASDIEIIDSDIIDGPGGATMEMFSSSSPVLYAQLLVVGATGPVGDPEDESDDFGPMQSFSDVEADVGSQPAQYLWTINYNNINQGAVYVGALVPYSPDTTGTIDACAGIWSRMRLYYQRIPQKYALKCKGYRLFQLAVGSRPLLTSGQGNLGEFGRLTERDGVVPRERRTVVTGWRPDPMNGTIDIEVELIPDYTTELPS